MYQSSEFRIFHENAYFAANWRDIRVFWLKCVRARAFDIYIYRYVRMQKQNQIAKPQLLIQR